MKLIRSFKQFENQSDGYNIGFSKYHIESLLQDFFGINRDMTDLSEYLLDIEDNNDYLNIHGFHLNTVNKKSGRITELAYAKKDKIILKIFSIHEIKLMIEDPLNIPLISVYFSVYIDEETVGWFTKLQNLTKDASNRIKNVFSPYGFKFTLPLGAEAMGNEEYVMSLYRGIEDWRYANTIFTKRKFESNLLKENKENNNTLVIVDVQKSFGPDGEIGKKYFSHKYVSELQNYCKNFKNVYQIFDNHIDGKDTDKEYLYDDYPDIPINGDLYKFPNQKDVIEKRYKYDVNVDFFKKILDKKIYSEIKEKEKNRSLKVGETFKTNEGTILTYVGNRHVWFHSPIKLYKLLNSLKGQNIEMVGGSDSECLHDIEVTAKSIGVNVKRNYKYIWSASHCAIK